MQALPHLKKLWLEENPCVEQAGPKYVFSAEFMIHFSFFSHRNAYTAIIYPTKWFPFIHLYSTLFLHVYSYRAIVLRALPNLEMLDNVSVTPEELADAMKGGNAAQSQEEIYEDAYSNGPSQQQTQQQQYQQQPQQQQQQQQFRQSSPVREVCSRHYTILLFI